jgi:hypothetical protein
MQHPAEMPKSVGQGVSLGTKQVPASGLVLPAAVWLNGQWEVLAKRAVAERFRGDSLSVNITFVCDAGIGCYSSSYRTVLKVWSADCQRSGRLFVSSFYVSTGYCNFTVLRTVYSVQCAVYLLCNSITYSVQCVVYSVQSAR